MMLQVVQDYNLLVNCMNLFRLFFFLSADSGAEATRLGPDIMRLVCTTEADRRLLEAITVHTSAALTSSSS